MDKELELFDPRSVDVRELRDKFGTWNIADYPHEYQCVIDALKWLYLSQFEYVRKQLKITEAVVDRSLLSDLTDDEVVSLIKNTVAGTLLLSNAILPASAKVHLAEAKKVEVVTYVCPTTAKSCKLKYGPVYLFDMTGFSDECVDYFMFKSKAFKAVQLE